MRTKRSTPRLLAGVVAGSLLLLGTAALPAVAAGAPDIAAGKAAEASSATGGNTADLLNDGNRNTYWQSAAVSAAEPQWAQVDLGRSALISTVTLKVPASWKSPTETLALQASDDGTLFSTVVGAKSSAVSRTVTG